MKWISISDRLPDEHVHVLVADSMGDMWIGEVVHKFLAPIGKPSGYDFKAIFWTYIDPFPFDDLIENCEKYRTPPSGEAKKKILKRMKREFIEDYVDGKVNAEISELHLAAILTMNASGPLPPIDSFK